MSEILVCQVSNGKTPLVEIGILTPYVSGIMSTPPSSPPVIQEHDIPTISSPEPKRRRLEPIDNSIVYGEPMHIRNESDWDWYPGLINKWVRQEQVPSPYFGASSSSGPHLPLLPCHLEQAFAAFVATMDREIRNMRDAAGAITGLLSMEKQTDHRMDLLVAELSGTDHMHNALVDEVRALQARVNVQEAEVESQERIGELETQLVAALEPTEIPDSEPGEEPEEDDAESVISSAGSGA
ncbi:hypothetical protein L1987_08546 [Smallanthus sonchifolius]|uniref:Uncharacterized protein n=1 Tax=Smallanthus sonchifolius TaxID=185202 RepID=A0ACB9JMM3_9ASTR|nr:hypothetical protein L1987_08546 [Smallanthus sonchifolius]